MQRSIALLFTTVVLLSSTLLTADDWTQFRGPGGLGVSDEKGLPLTWSSKENIVWKQDLPGPGASSPITLGNRIFVTCYSGYGLEAGQGDQKDLVRHLLCLDRKTGKTLWHEKFEPKLPEHKYQGEGSYHGYAASTPTSDGQRLYVFFGKSGVFCFDLDGKQLWHAEVGESNHHWGSGCSPVLVGDLLIINAGVESGSLIALNKLTGKEVWSAKGIRSSWNTPLLARAKGKSELIVSIQNQVLSFDPKTGDPLWNADGVHRYVLEDDETRTNASLAVSNAQLLLRTDAAIYCIGGGR